VRTATAPTSRYRHHSIAHRDVVNLQNWSATYGNIVATAQIKIQTL
jgi:hypothetical protein